MTKNINLAAGRPSARRKQEVRLEDVFKDPVKMKRVNFDLSEDSHKKLKKYAIDQQKSVREVLTEYVESLPE